MVPFHAETMLREMWRAAIAAAQPAVCLPRHWPALPAGRLAVIACGKAAAAMASEAARHYRDNCRGIVILPDGQAEQAGFLDEFQPFLAGHPVPNEGSMIAARAALNLAKGLTDNDLLLVLLSGGGSSLMCLPAGVSLNEKQALTRQLLACGAPIQEINCVRKHLSRIKGGRLAMASGAPVVTLAISDVPGDSPAVIASGPTVLDPTAAEDAVAVVDRYGIGMTTAVRKALTRTAAETSVHASIATRDRYQIVASGMTALRAAASWCRKHGIDPVVLGDDLQGEARQLAREHAVQALELAARGGPTCLLSGGESTVKLSENPGKGGRNTEYALSLALALDCQPGIWALAADTDGIDGSGGHSGAVIRPDTLKRTQRQMLDARDHLYKNDSASYFARVGGLMIEGPTGTNVNDFRAILINPR